MLVIQISALFLIETIIDVQTAKILAVYPCPSISHQVVFRPITLELLRRGHDVTVMTPDPMFLNGNTPQNLTEIDVHDISYGMLAKYFATYVTEGVSSIVHQTKMVMKLNLDVVEEQMRTQAMRDIINNKTETFDVILLEAMFVPALGLSHLFKAPVILVSSFGAFIGNYDIVGASTHPFLYPNIVDQRLYNLTLWEKVTTLYKQYQIRNFLDSLEEKSNKVIKRIFGPTTPPLSILKNNVDMLFLNIHPIWEGNFPVPPNVIHMGGLHQKPAKQLPKELQEYLDSSDNGVIYFSLGTNVKPSLLPQEIISLFEKVFSQLPYNVIWKWDTENFQVKSQNIKIFEWLPQADLLRHPNIKAFITQGGLQSTDEAITAGVPLIGIPMIVDQWYNVEKYVHHKIGVKLQIEQLTEDTFRNAIITVAEDISYRNNIARLRSIMQDHPQSPLERTIWWIEYVLRHGGAKHLRAPAANISWSEYLELELVSVIIIGIISLVVMVIYMSSQVLKNVWSYEKLKIM